MGFSISDPKNRYRSVGNTWACFVTLRLHMPTDYGVTPINFGSLRYASAPNAHVKFKKKSRCVTQRHHMPTSVKKVVTLRNDVICPRSFKWSGSTNKRRRHIVHKHVIKLHCTRLHQLRNIFRENSFGFGTMLLHAELRLHCKCVVTIDAKDQKVVLS